MTQDEKLNSFYTHSIDTANEQAAKIVGDHKAVLDSLFAEHKEMRLRQAEAEVNDERERLKKEKNKLLSAEQLTIRRSESLTAYRIREKVFAEVEEKLNAFKQSPDYFPYLCRKLEEAKRIASGREAVYLIDESDSALAGELSEKCGIPVTVSEESFLGGIRAVILSRNLLIDQSFRTSLDEEKTNYRFEGGEWHA